MIPTEITEVKTMPKSLTLADIATGQIVNLWRNGVPLRCRVAQAGLNRKSVFVHVRQSLPSSPHNACSFLAVSGPAEPLADSGKMRCGTGIVEMDSLLLVADPAGGHLEIAGRPVDVELVADPRCN